MELSPDWEFVADTVMGGVSTGKVSQTEIAGRNAARLNGEVSLENNGGFIQMAFDLATDGSAVDLSAYEGISFEVLGNGQPYELRVRTTDLTRPWQSYRAAFDTSQSWQNLRIAFADLDAHRTDAPFDAKKVRRIGIVAVGRAFDVDVAVSGMRFYP